jgi:SAM-dependent methyltransferase
LKRDYEHHDGIRGRPYSRKFYEAQEHDSIRSAELIVPIVNDLIRPNSVVDVGCGTGTWLSVFQKLGVQDVIGIDGDWVEPRSLRIPPERFHVADLSGPTTLERKFDLVISLEVAEHLPASSAATFVDSLVSLGPVVLFSAAIPHQGGTHHVNEQWPEYWVRLFELRGYLVIDCIRRRVWNNPEVQWWYAQNTFIFATDARLQESPLLTHERESTHRSQLALVHPRKFLAVTDPMNLSTKALAQMAVIKLWSRVRKATRRNERHRLS